MHLEKKSVFKNVNTITILFSISRVLFISCIGPKKIYTYFCYVRYEILVHVCLIISDRMCAENMSLIALVGPIRLMD